MSPITLGILAASGAASVGSYELITSTVLTSSAASVTFSGLNAGTYKHLQIRATARTTTAVGSSIFLRFNGDTGSNYSKHQLYGLGSGSAGSNSDINQTSVYVGMTSNTDQAAYVFSSSVVEILDAFSTTKNKTTRALSGFVDSSKYIVFRSGAWYSTSAVTSILLYPDADSFATGSRFSIYGLRA